MQPSTRGNDPIHVGESRSLRLTAKRLLAEARRPELRTGRGRPPSPARGRAGPIRYLLQRLENDLLRRENEQLRTALASRIVIEQRAAAARA